MSKSQKREHYYKRYSENLREVRQHPNLHVASDLEDLFICPICLRPFGPEALLENKLSLEHLPPEKLGGKVRTLTCRECNNHAGTTLEEPLRKHIEARDFFSGVSNSSLEASYHVNNIDVGPATIIRTDPNNWVIEGHPGRTDPKNLKRLYEILQADSQNFNFKLLFHVPKDHNPAAALIRIAYLWAFSEFGYGFMVNQYLDAVRSQISNPKDNILSCWGIFNYDTPDEFLGVNMIVEPKEMRSFLIIFDLTGPNGLTTRFEVILPGPTEPGLSVYDRLHDREQVQMTHLFHYENVDFIKYPYALHDVWHGIMQQS